MRSRISTLLFLCLLMTGIVEGQSAFKFNAKRVSVGTVYHYVKTNVDGTKPENISLYVATVDRIESFKFHEKGSRAGLVIADMDWTIFSAKKLESWQVASGDERKLFATLTYRAAEKAVEVSIPQMRPTSEFAKIEQLPFHLYNFDLASLNLSFPHLAVPRGNFTVGIADPTFNADGPMFAYRGELAVRYEKTEIRNGGKCRRYAASGTGIGGKGTIWVDKKKGYIRDMEFDVANNPDWSTFKLRLIRTEKMSEREWKRFIAAQF